MCKASPANNKADPKRMSFTEIMRLVTKRPVVDHRHCALSTTSDNDSNAKSIVLDTEALT